MKIMMVTNTFTPHVGGVARSVQRFTDEYRKLGHQVCVVAPGAVGKRYPEDINTIRIPAADDVGGSSFYLPVLTKNMEKNIAFASAFFYPDVVHAHQPFLLGDLARRISARLKKPLVYTQHTLYENFNHLFKGGRYTSDFLKRVSTEYANLCDAVIAPSESLQEILLARGVRVPTHVVPTGIDVSFFANGDRAVWRDRFGISNNNFLMGYIGRLSPEKNLSTLAGCVRAFLNKSSRTHFLVVGDGPSHRFLKDSFRDLPRVHFTGSLSGKELADAYRALDVFAFPSCIETQGLVLAEAMAAGVPVTAFAAQGTKDIVVDGVNGRLAPHGSRKEFCKALAWCLEHKNTLQKAAMETAKGFAKERCAGKALALYEQVQYSPKGLVRALSFLS